MPLQTQYVPLDFGGTLDQKTDKRLVIPGNFTNLENVVFTKVGSLQKRPGNTALTTTVFNGGAAFTAPRALAGQDNSVALFDKYRAYTLNSAKTYWVQHGFIPEFMIDETIVTSFQASSKAITCAYATNGFAVYLYQTGTQVFSTVVDSAGVLVQNNLLVATGKNPRIAVVGNTIYALYSVTTNIFCKTMDMTNPIGWSAASGALATTYDGGSAWDAISISTGILMGYGNGSNIVLSNIPASLTGIVTMSIPSAMSVVRIVSIGVNEASNSVWAAWSGTIVNGSGLDYKLLAAKTVVNLSGSIPTPVVLDLTTTPDPNGGKVRIGVTSYGSVGIVVCNRPASGGLECYRITGATFTHPVRTIYNQMLLASKPFTIGSKVYAMLRNSEESTFYLANMDAGLEIDTVALRPVATFGAYRANNNDDVLLEAALVSDVSLINSTTVLLPGLTNLGNALNVSKFVASLTEPYTHDTVGDTLALGCGIPASFDGSVLSEYGFLVTPKCTAPVQAPTGGVLVDGIYRYRVTYEWADARGNISRSTPSKVSEKEVNAGTNTATLTFAISYCTFTNKQTGTVDGANPINVVVYRESPINSGIYRRLIPVNYAALFPGNMNDVTSSTLSFIDDGSQNTNLLTGEQLYTNSELPNIHPPSSRYTVVHQGRVWLAGCDSETLLLYSKPVDEAVSPAFTAQGSTNIHEGGAITGLASMDDKLIVFKERAIYALYGDGPGPSGQGQAFGLTRIAADTGCSSGYSIVTTRDGVMYKAPVGICLLSRSLQVQYVGAPVEDVVNEYGTFTSAVTHPTESWVLFTLGPNTNGHGVTLMYDYFYQKWSKWFFKVNSVADKVVQAADVSNGLYTWITSDAKPCQESTAYLDDGAYVSMTIETAWLKFAGLVGFQRVRDVLLLGEAVAPHDLQLSFATNYDDSAYSQSLTFSSSVLVWPSEQFGAKIINQKSSSLRIKIKDIQGAVNPGSGAGPIIAGLGLSLGVKGNLFNNLPIVQGG